MNLELSFPSQVCVLTMFKVQATPLVKKRSDSNRLLIFLFENPVIYVSFSDDGLGYFNNVVCIQITLTCGLYLLSMFSVYYLSSYRWNHFTRFRYYYSKQLHSNFFITVVNICVLMFPVSHTGGLWLQPISKLIVKLQQILCQFLSSITTLIILIMLSITIRIIMYLQYAHSFL